MQVQEKVTGVRVAARTPVRISFPVPSRTVDAAESEAQAQLVFGRSCRRRVVARAAAPRVRRRAW